MSQQDYAEAVRAAEEILFSTHPYLSGWAEALPGFQLPVRADYRAKMQECAQTVKRLSPPDTPAFLRLFLPLISALNDEHTRVPFYEAPPFARLAVVPEIAVRGGRLVLFTGGEATQVLAVNAVAEKPLLTELRSYFSGVDDAMKAARLNMRLAAALKLRFGDAPLTLETASAAIPARYAVREQEKDFTFRISGETACMRIGSFTAEKTQFARWVGDAFEQASQRGCKKLTLDLTDNDGGTTANGDFILTRLLNVPFFQICWSDIFASAASRRYFAPYVPPALARLHLQRFTPVFGRLYAGKDGACVKKTFPPIRPVGDFAGVETEVVLNEASVSTCAMFAAAMLHYGKGTLRGPCGGFATHYGCQLPISIPGADFVLEAPCAVNHGWLAGPFPPEAFCR